MLGWRWDEIYVTMSHVDADVQTYIMMLQQHVADVCSSFWVALEGFFPYTCRPIPCLALWTQRKLSRIH